MNEEKLQAMMRAHAMGVEDVKTAFKLIITERMGLSPEATKALVSVVDNIVILPTRVLREVVDADAIR
jgi:hypothetical protein